MHKELSTIRDFIRFAITQFNAANLYYGHGTENALDDAIMLILRSLSLPLDIDSRLLSGHLIERERALLFDLIMRRIDERTPVAYLTHEAFFAGLPFYVDQRVLIPRSLLSDVIAQQFQPWIVEADVENILDLCTGSGCIAIACAKAFPNAIIDASDLSKDALDVAKKNVEHYQLSDQITLHESDLFAALTPKKYDVIISNPPYVSADEMQSLPPEYLHEPRLALHADQDGLAIVIRILHQASEYLHPHGVLIIEVGNSGVVLQERFPSIPFTWLSLGEDEGGAFIITHDELKQHVMPLTK